MKATNISERGHWVNVLPAIDIAGGKTGDRFKMTEYDHVSIGIQIGVSAAAFTKIIVRECDAETGGTANDIAFAVYKEETSNGDTLGPRVAVAAAGLTPSANDNILYVIEIDARELTDGFPWIEVALTDDASPTTSVEASIIAILSGARYGNDQSATAIA